MVRLGVTAVEAVGRGVCGAQHVAAATAGAAGTVDAGGAAYACPHPAPLWPTPPHPPRHAPHSRHSKRSGRSAHSSAGSVARSYPGGPPWSQTQHLWARQGRAAGAARAAVGEMGCLGVGLGLGVGWGAGCLESRLYRQIPYSNKKGRAAGASSMWDKWAESRGWGPASWRGRLGCFFTTVVL